MSNVMYESWAATVLRWRAGTASVGCTPTEEEQRQALLAGAAALEVVNQQQLAGRGSAIWRATARLRLRHAWARLKAALDGKDERIDHGG